MIFVYRRSIITIKEIAELADVSVSTVSKVLNNKTDVGSETRQRILDIIGRHNYKRRVSAVKGQVVGIIVPFKAHPSLSRPYASSIIFGFAEYLIEREFRVELIPNDIIHKSKMGFFQFCTESNISAAVFVLSTPEDQYIAEFADVLPVAATSNHFPNSRVITVGFDSYNAAREAVLHLVGLGHKRFLFISEDQLHWDQIQRFRAYKDVLRGNGLDYNPEHTFIISEHEEEDIHFFLANVLKSSHPPTAFVVSNDLIVTRVLEILGSLHVDVPDDISIVGFDDLPFSRFIRPPLTTVSQPMYEIGKQTAVEIFKRVKNGEDHVTRDIWLKGHLIVRSSTAPLEN